MGAYLPKPNIHKDSFDDVNEFLACGASSMQGWRSSQEDAHNCILNFDANTSFFAVYDGHGGSEVAIYCSKYLPNLLKELEEYKSGDLETALKKSFLDIDAILLKEDVIEELKTILESENKVDGETGEDEEEDLDKLCEESKMPLNEVLEKYKELRNKPKVNDEFKAGGSSSSSGCGSSNKPGGSKSLPIITTSPSSSSSSSSSSSKLDSTDKKDEEAAKGSSGDTLENKNESNSSKTNLENNDIINDKLEANDKSDDKVIVNGESDVKPETSKCESEKSDDSKSVKSGSKDAEKSESGSSKSTTTENGSLTKRFKPKIEMDSSDDDSEEELDASYEESAESSDDNDEDDEEIDDMEDDEDEDEDDYEDEEMEDEETNAFMENITEEPGKDSGCTAVVALLQGKELFVANAGDSRCVVCRGGKALEMSFDHKPEDEEEHNRIKKAGGKVTLDGRVNGGLNLSRAIGDHAYKMNPRLEPEQQMISAMPDVKKISLTADDDFMVLACDGIWNSMTSDAVVDFVSKQFESKSVNLSDICSNLFDKCLAPDTIGDGTGCDNMTAIVVKFKKSLTGDIAIDAVHTATNNTTTIATTMKRTAIDDASIETNSKKLKIDNTKIENSEENENKAEVKNDNHLS